VRPRWAALLSNTYTQQIASQSETPALDLTFIRKAERFSKLSRYRAVVKRSLYKALHELQRLQAVRSAEAKVPPPAAIDINVYGISREDL
jgi:hypothetical protein